MRKHKYSGKAGYTVIHDVIRNHIGYGKIFSRRDLYTPFAVTPGTSLAPGCSLEDVIESMVKYGFLKSFEEEGEKRYLLVRVDQRKEPIMGFNPYRK
jgi:hypothetical protein